MSEVKTVLVVDDSSLNRVILEQILDKDYEIIEAENGKEALEVLESSSAFISAIMLDVVMPVMDGFGFLQAVREDARFNNIPIIVTTGYDDFQNERKALSMGAWDFVSKPYDRQIIQFRIKNAIDRSQLTALNQLKYYIEFDPLTGIYNKQKFFSATHAML